MQGAEESTTEAYERQYAAEERGDSREGNAADDGNACGSRADALMADQPAKGELTSENNGSMVGKCQGKLALTHQVRSTIFF